MCIAVRQARQSELEASESAKSASESVITADMDAKLAQSYSIGKSGIRDGEETDNAKYYSEKAETVSANVPSYLKQIEDAGNSQIDKINDAFGKTEATFKVNFETGHLEYTGARFTFEVADNGHLNWEVN